MITNEIDIIVINCNNDGYIQKCINSIREQTEEPYTLIAIDQNSKDGSREWLLKNVSHVVLNKRNVGSSEGFNQGIRVGKSPWIVLVDSDIIIKDRFWLDKMWNYTLRRRIGFIEASTWNDLTKKWQFGRNSFCMIRRQCFNEIGVFDKKFVYGGDLDWFIRLEWSWWKSAYCVDTNIFHHKGVTMRDTFKIGMIKKIKKGRDALLKFKYNKEFLAKTLYEYEWRKIRKERELGWRI